MQRADLPDVADFAALQAKKRRLLFALAGNLLLLVVMVGGPWLRGYLRARQSWRDFGRFTACLYGGKPSPRAGSRSAAGQRGALRGARVRARGGLARALQAAAFGAEAQ